MQDPKSNHVAEKPAVPSLLETYPQLLNICSHILPNAPLKQLYLAFPNARPRSRAEWEAFQNAQREAQKEVSLHFSAGMLEPNVGIPELSDLLQSLFRTASVLIMLGMVRDLVVVQNLIRIHLKYVLSWPRWTVHCNC